MPKIYWERQRNKLCRKHALNAFFGCNKISEAQFYKYCDEYNNYVKKRFSMKDIDSKKMDVIPSNQLNIISFILKKFKIPTLYIAIDKFEKTLNERKFLSFEDLIQDGEFVFMFNKDHVWGLKKFDDEWYNVDSISGVKKIQINDINFNKHGFIIPRSLSTMKNDIKKNVVLIKNLFSESTIDEYLNYLKKENKLMGPLEYLVGVLIEWLYLLENPKIKKIFEWYEEFIVLYEISHSYYLIRNYVPLILKFIFLINNFI